MSIEVKVPTLSESITEATVGTILKSEGDFVENDEIICELETEKVSLEVTASESGIVGKFLKKEGDTVFVGDVLCTISEGSAKPDTSTSENITETEKESESIKNENEQSSAPSENNSPIASPAAKVLMQERNINPDTVSPSSTNPSNTKSIITKADVLNHTVPENTSNTPQHNTRSESVQKMSKLRQIIAKRLKETQNTAAMLTTFNEVNMDAVIEMRTKYKDLFEKRHGIKLGFMSIFSKAAAYALQEIPAVNAAIDGNNIVYKNYCDISIAVSTDKGLVVPVVRNVESMSLADVEKTILNLAKKAREGLLTIEDMSGGTFTITNGGVFGSLLSTPIINPPQSAILGMHATQERPVVVNGEIKIAKMMYLALSYDHRIIDGKEAVTFLRRVKEMIEDPSRIVLGV